MAVFALLAIFLCGIPIWLKFVLSGLALFQSTFILRKWFSAKPVHIACGEGGWRLVDVDGHEKQLELRGWLHRGMLLMLEFACAEIGTCRYLLTPGNSDTELRRRLLLVLSAQKVDPATGVMASDGPP